VADKDAPATDLILSLLDDRPEVPGWKWSASVFPLSEGKQALPQKQAEATKSSKTLLTVPEPKAFVESIQRAAHALIKAEPEITRMDSIAGDGDCGLTLKVMCLFCHSSSVLIPLPP
jgi:dihydroxyacetone kinase